MVTARRARHGYVLKPFHGQKDTLGPTTQHHIVLHYIRRFRALMFISLRTMPALKSGLYTKLIPHPYAQSGSSDTAQISLTQLFKHIHEKFVQINTHNRCRTSTLAILSTYVKPRLRDLHLSPRSTKSVPFMNVLWKSTAQIARVDKINDRQANLNKQNIYK